MALVSTADLQTLRLRSARALWVQLSTSDKYGLILNPKPQNMAQPYTQNPVRSGLGIGAVRIQGEGPKSYTCKLAG